MYEYYKIIAFFFIYYRENTVYMQVLTFEKHSKRLLYVESV